MKRNTLSGHPGWLLSLALLWSLSGAFGYALSGWLAAPPTAHAASPQNPDNPCAAKGSNPCNPDPAKGSNPCNPELVKRAQAANPCNPDLVKAANPCNPDAAQAANPCNPDATQAANPCNPDATQAANPCNPDAAQAANPCNPDAARAGLSASGAGQRIDGAEAFQNWSAVTGYVFSPPHGNRLVRTFIDPPAAAEIYKKNAELARLRKASGFKPYPPGTRILQQSWLRNEQGGAGKPGPLFLMRKEQPGYDPDGADWHYGFAASDKRLIGEGHDGKMQFCEDCHAQANRRDFVYATER
jgi:hypothetical protein